MDDEIAVKVDHVSKKYHKPIRSSMLCGVTDVSRNVLGLKSFGKLERE